MSWVTVLILEKIAGFALNKADFSGSTKVYWLQKSFQGCVKYDFYVRDFHEQKSCWNSNSIESYLKTTKEWKVVLQKNCTAREQYVWKDGASKRYMVATESDEVNIELHFAKDNQKTTLWIKKYVETRKTVTAGSLCASAELQIAKTYVPWWMVCTKMKKGTLNT